MPRRKIIEVSVQRDLSPGQWEACDSPADGMRFRQSCQSRRDNRVFQTETSVVADAESLLHHNMACIIYHSQYIYIHMVNLGADGTRAQSEKHLAMLIELALRCTFGL